MSRSLMILAVMLVTVVPADAKRAAPPPPVVRAIRADAVFVGKVTSIEKDTIAVPLAPGDAEKVVYMVAVIKVETGLAGVNGVTHVKLAFLPPPPEAAGRIRGASPNFVPTEGTEALFFLTKHPRGDFYTSSWMNPPVEAKAASFKADVESAKLACVVLADPLKALKAEKPEDRFLAATLLVARYRAYPEHAAETQNVKIAAEESQLILKALAERMNWGESGRGLSATQAMFMLGLTEAEGWQQPVRQPGMPEDMNNVYRNAFIAWLSGAGKNYTVTRIVAK